MNKKVLICDDDADILNLTGSYLETEGYDVTKQRNCDNIVADLKRIQPSIVLMDLKVPTTGGEEATRRIKNDPATKDIPVLLFTANTNGREIAVEIGAEGVIEKPFDLDDLIRTIKDSSE